MQLAAARDTHGRMNRDMVADVVRSVLTTMTGDLTAAETSLLGEVESLGRIINAAKQDIAALRVDEINDRDIPSATDELDAIIEHTAGATNAILESCEMMEALADGLTGDAAAKLQDAITKIYEACGFQDITGQRITKIVTTLKVIETKVAQIIGAFGPRGSAAAPPPAIPEVSGEAALLNGPQMPAAAMDQTDIDRLLASFG